MAFTGRSYGKKYANNTRYNNAFGGYREYSKFTPQPKKRSSAKRRMNKNQKENIIGYYLVRKTLVSFIISASKNTKEVVGTNGRTYLTLVCKLSSPFGSHLVSCLKSVATGKYYLPDCRVVISPDKNYAGVIRKKVN